MVEDGKGGITPHPTETELEPAEWFFEPEQLEVSWPQAFQIHNQRIGAKRGKAIAESTLKNQLAARKGVDKPPQAFTVTDVRRYEQQLWDQGLSPNTVSQRFVMMRAVMTSLQKKGFWKPTSSTGSRFQPSKVNHTRQQHRLSASCCGIAATGTSDCCSRQA